MSYVTVVRNAERTVERMLRSVQTQTWPAVEHIVLDGDSTDGTLDVLLRHADRLDYVASEPDDGLYHALNKAIPLARGSLICVLNADDALEPDAAERAVRAHQSAGSPRQHLVLGTAWLIDSQGRRLWAPGPLDLAAYLRCAVVCHNAVYATPAVYEATGPYATHLRVAADFQWLMATVDAGIPATPIRDVLVHYAAGGVSADTPTHVHDCATVMAERFPFLTEAEVYGLLHVFHAFRKNLRPLAAHRPPDLARFLADVTHRHAAQADFMTAVAQASAQVLQHPQECRGALGATLRGLPGQTWRALRRHVVRRPHDDA